MSFDFREWKLEDWYDNQKFEIKLIKVDEGSEYPSTVGVLVKDRKTGLFSVSNIEVPVDEYGYGSFPGKVKCITESDCFIKLEYTFETGSRFDWTELEYKTFLPKPFLKVDSKKLLDELLFLLLKV